MPVTRRRFLQGCAIATLSPTLVRGASLRSDAIAFWKRAGLPETASGLVNPETFKTLALRALDAAKSAGASYADVRLTRTIGNAPIQMQLDSELLAVGVRCLVNGVWGFASSCVWSLEEMEELARRAVTIAKSTKSHSKTPVELAPVAPVTGSWNTPIEIDPFTVPLEERWDFADAAQRYIERYDSNPHKFATRSLLIFLLYRQERALATSEGTFCTQTIYRTDVRGVYGHFQMNGLGVRGGGWEVLRNSKWREQIPQLIERSIEYNRIPKKQGTLGRYNVVCSPAISAKLVGATFGSATSLNIAMGYDNNTEGDSFLGARPLDLLGSAQVSSPSVTVTANRSAPAGLATVQWDDEGVVPENTTLIKNGVLVDFQTTREEATWLAPYYQKSGKPVRSHGYAWSLSALTPPLESCPNLELEPGPNGSTDDLIRETKDGLYLMSGHVNTAFQGKLGQVAGLKMREIKNGKLGDIVDENISMYFNAAEIWKNVTAVGGRVSPNELTNDISSSGDVTATDAIRGEPRQWTPMSVRAVPIAIRNTTFIEPSRRG